MATLLRRYGTLIGFILILAFFWFRLPDTFMTARNWLNITQQLSMLMVVAAGMIVALVTLILVWVLLEQTTFGRRLYAIGGNVEAAHLAGVGVRRLKLIAFSLTGLSAAGAGIMYASRVASANLTQGSGLMLNAI